MKKVRIYVSGNPVNSRDPSGNINVSHMFGQIVQAVQGGLKWASHGVQNAARTANQVAYGKHHNENSLSHKLGRSDYGSHVGNVYNQTRNYSAFIGNSYGNFITNAWREGGSLATNVWHNEYLKPANWLKNELANGIDNFQTFAHNATYLPSARYKIQFEADLSIGRVRIPGLFESNLNLNMHINMSLNPGRFSEFDSERLNYDFFNDKWAASSSQSEMASMSYFSVLYIMTQDPMFSPNLGPAMFFLALYSLGTLYNQETRKWLDNLFHHPGIW